MARMDGTKEGEFFCRGRDGFGLGWNLLLGTDTNGFFRVGSVTTSPSTVGNVYLSTIQALPNTWYNLIGVKNSNVTTAYINGVSIGYTSDNNNYSSPIFKSI